MKIKTLLEKASHLSEMKQEEVMEILEEYLHELEDDKLCDLEEELDFTILGPSLTKEQANAAIEHMYNDYGDAGRIYSVDEIKQIAITKSIDFHKENFNECDFDWAVHMFYYDQTKFLKKIASDRNKHLEYCADMAIGFLDDPDAPEDGKGKAKRYIYAMKD